MEITDIFGLKHPSKLTLRIIDSCEKALGFVFSEKIAKKDAKAHLIREKAVAEAEATKIILVNRAHLVAEQETELSKTVAGRALLRKSREETREQENLEAILFHAISYAEKNSSSFEALQIEHKDLDQDWFADYKDIAKNISNEKMRELWGRVLAHQVANADSFTNRDLTVLKSLTASEAEIFRKFCQLLVEPAESIFIINSRFFTDDTFDYYGLNVDDLVELNSLNLIMQPVGWVDNILPPSVKEAQLTIGERSFIANATVPIHLIKPLAVKITSTGRRLARLIDKHAPDDYVKWIIDTLGGQGYAVTEITRDQK